MGIVNYIKDSFKELEYAGKHGCQYLKLRSSTVVVAVFSVLFALAVFAVDKVFQLGLEQYFNLF